MKQILFIFFLCMSCGQLPVRSYKPVADLSAIPQVVDTIINNLPERVRTTKKIKAMRASFNRSFYSPWLRKKLLYSVTIARAPQLLKRQYYGINYLPLPPAWFAQLNKKANFKRYGSINKPGLILEHANLRVLPTYEFCFLDPESAGEGFPFDYLQADLLYVGTPVRISHYSQDKAWVFVDTGSMMCGWVSSHQVARINTHDAKKYMAYPLAAMRFEKEPLYEPIKKTFLTYSKIGMVLPYAHSEQTGLVLVYPRRDYYGNLVFMKVKVSKKLAAAHPLPMTHTEVRSIIKQLLGTTYCWSSAFSGRDCSALTKDFAAVFGAYLNRTVQTQIHNGTRINVKGMTDQKKLKIIREKAIPFTTLLSTGSHIMLYVGYYKNEPVVYHNKWGIVTARGVLRGRNIIGKTVLTTLRPGKELPDYSKDMCLLVKTEVLIVLDL